MNAKILKHKIPETIDNLSPITLAKIAEVRGNEEKGHIKGEHAARQIRFIIGRATNNGVAISKSIDLSQMYIARDGMNRIYSLLRIASGFISRKMYFDGSPLDDEYLDAGDADGILEMLESVKATLREVDDAVIVLCAD